VNRVVCVVIVLSLGWPLELQCSLRVSRVSESLGERAESGSCADHRFELSYQQERDAHRTTRNSTSRADSKSSTRLLQHGGNEGRASP